MVSSRVCPFPLGAPGLAGQPEEQTAQPSTLIRARGGGLQGCRAARAERRASASDLGRVERPVE